MGVGVGGWSVARTGFAGSLRPEQKGHDQRKPERAGWEAGPGKSMTGAAWDNFSGRPAMRGGFHQLYIAYTLRYGKPGLSF